VGPTEVLSSDALAAYSWPQVLRMPIRNLLDFYFEAGMTPQARVQEAQPLTQLAGARLDELRQVVRQNMDGPPVARIEARVTRSVAVPALPEVRTVTFQGWEVSLGYAPLDSGEATEFVGSLDLLDSDRRAAFPAVPTVEPLRETSLPTNSTTAKSIPWPWVTHTTFWGYERAVKWLKLVDGLWQGQPDQLFGSWIAVMTAQLFDAPADSSMDDPQQWPRTWPTLATRLGKLPRTPAPQGQATVFELLAERWLLAVGLLCTPEMGMSKMGMSTSAGLVPAELQGRVADLRRGRRKSLPTAAQRIVDESLPEQPTERPDHSAPRGSSPQANDTTERVTAKQTPRRRKQP
jgi:hypothetical protein